MTEANTMDILRIVLAGGVVVVGTVLLIVLIRKHNIRWSGNAGVGLGAVLILCAMPLGWICSITSLAPTLVFLAFGIWALHRGIRRNRQDDTTTTRRRTGYCVDCGYDLTGNQSGLCPECGKAMTRSVRRKRAVKVIGLVLSIMMLGLWVFSVMFASHYEPPGRPWCISSWFGRIGLAIPPGHVHYGYSVRALQSPDSLRWACTPTYTQLAVPPKIPWAEFAHDRLGFGLPFDCFGTIYVPVWLMLLGVGFPTAILWWRDRRPKAGFCNTCKYDLTGNESGICPECGTAI